MFDINARMDAWDKANRAQNTEEMISFIKSNGDDVGGNMTNGSIACAPEAAPAPAPAKNAASPLATAWQKYRSGSFTRSNPYNFDARVSAWNQAGISSEETVKILKSTSASERFRKSADIAAAVDGMGEEELAAKLMEAIEELMGRMGA